jgi:hypothetical protein
MSLLVFGIAEKPMSERMSDQYMCRYNGTAWMTFAVLNEFVVCLDKEVTPENRKMLIFFIGVLHILKNVSALWHSLSQCMKA